MVNKINMVGKVFNIMIVNIVLDTIIDGRRYMLRTDKYNYIWREGSPDLDDEIFLKQTRENSYFTTFDALTRHIFKNAVKRGIVSLDTEKVLEAYENALTLATDIGAMLEEKISEI
mgnify:FL=1